MNSAVCTVASPARRPTPANRKQTTFPIRRFVCARINGDRALSERVRVAPLRPRGQTSQTLRRMPSRRCCPACAHGCPRLSQGGEPRPRNAPFQAIVRKRRSNDYLLRMREKQAAKALRTPAARRRGEPRPDLPHPKTPFLKTPSLNMLFLSPHKKRRPSPQDDRLNAKMSRPRKNAQKGFDKPEVPPTGKPQGMPKPLRSNNARHPPTEKAPPLSRQTAPLAARHPAHRKSTGPAEAFRQITAPSLGPQGKHEMTSMAFLPGRAGTPPTGKVLAASRLCGAMYCRHPTYRESTRKGFDKVESL